MPTPLDNAIDSALDMNASIGDLFAEIGTSAHPDGSILTIYRNSNIALQAALLESDPSRAVNDVLRKTRRDLQVAVALILQAALVLGQEEAQRQLELYGIPVTGSINLTDETQSALNAVMARFDVQAASIAALVLTNADPAQIVGDENRNGIFSGFEIATSLAFWATYLIWNNFDQNVWVNTQTDTRPGERKDVFMKVAVAVLDERTTECCLRVHGQVQPLDQPFRLTGTPRFADEMDWPAFHNHCRTSVALINANHDKNIPDSMKADANKIIEARNNKKKPSRDA